MRLKVSSAKWRPFCLGLNVLTCKQLEMLGCVFNTTATDAMILKHQARSSHSAEEILIALVQFYTKILHLQKTTLEKKYFEINNPIV